MILSREMADKYDSNGDYNNYSGSNSSDFKRKSRGPPDSNVKNDNTREDDSNDDQNPAAQKAAEYMRELLAEKISLDHGKCPHAARLIDQEVSKVQVIGKAPPREFKYVDIYREKPIKVSVKVLVPVREHPRFNFVGKLLGPKGNSMKRLQEETMCKMAVLGRGSMKDRAKEEELRNSLDPKYAHLSDDLHVEISALGPPAEAHARVAFALAEVRKYLIPDNNDNIRQEQMREMEIISTIDPNTGEEIKTTAPRGFKRGAPPAGPILRGGPPSAAPRVARPALGGVRTVPAPPGVPGRGGGGIPSAGGTRGVMPAKTKILSILDRARVAMEESYGGGFEEYETSQLHGVPHHHERSYVEYVPPTSHGYTGSHHYDEYEEEYYPPTSRHHEPADPYDEPTTRSWKSYKPSSSSSSRHHDSSRYRTSPYTRPSK